MTRVLVIDTATAACSVALFAGERLIASLHEEVSRGHAERLVPMIAELPDGGRADHILVDVGPGSFTGIRVGIAAARGLALGWGTTIGGYSSLALIAAGAVVDGIAGALAAVIEGGHGEIFMQGFVADPFAATDELRSVRPADALLALGERHAVGSGVARLVGLPAAQDGGPRLPRARDALALPPAARQLPPRPLYGRAPDAKLPAAAMSAA